MIAKKAAALRAKHPEFGSLRQRSFEVPEQLRIARTDIPMHHGPRPVFRHGFLVFVISQKVGARGGLSRGFLRLRTTANLPGVL